MNLTDLATRLEACADKLPSFSPRADRLNALADAARDLDRLRDYRRYMVGSAYLTPLGDAGWEVGKLRYEIRNALTLAADLRSWAYREVV
jgi:hypothetical protein